MEKEQEKYGISQKDLLEVIESGTKFLPHEAGN